MKIISIFELISYSSDDPSNPLMSLLEVYDHIIWYGKIDGLFISSQVAIDNKDNSIVASIGIKVYNLNPLTNELTKIYGVYNNEPSGVYLSENLIHVLCKYRNSLSSQILLMSSVEFSDWSDNHHPGLKKELILQEV